MASDSEDFVYFLGKGQEVPKHATMNHAPLLSEILATTDSENEEVAMDDSPSAAVNEETGEINWDCPCLKSALEPPCGHTFKAAFGCFVASKTEPKGLDCHELFKVMQECFQAHPEKYGAILDDDELLEPLNLETNTDDAADDQP